MKKTPRFLLRITLLLLSILLFVPSFSHIKAEGEDGTKMLHSRFYVLTAQDYREFEVPFNRDWFRADASGYSHDLAKLSLGLATAAFRPSRAHLEGVTSYDENLTNFLSEAGFSDLSSDDYDKNPSMYTVSTVMGHQKIGSGDDAFELIAVGVCGQGYIDEWESNFSIGSGNVHDGFRRSSELVFNRIFGYIAANHLEGPLKVWISGFSRAAAVSNLTAAMLVDTDVFDASGVFAYTFATPRNVRDQDFARYPNIFNIVGKTDPVPLVPFADWGYERYGTTLYLPAMETDSDFDLKREKANGIYKELTGIDYWYNKETYVVLKNVLGYLLTLSPSVDIYAESLQEKLIHIWEDRSPVNILSNLLSIANDPVLINEKTKDEADALLNYLVSMIGAYRAQDSIFRRWNSRASSAINLAQAHTPELYISWVYSENDPEQLYNYYDEYSILYVNASYEVSLLRDGKVVESLPAIYATDADTWQTTELIPKKDRVVPDSFRYMDYTDDQIRILLPRDEAYSVYVKCEKKNFITVLKLDYSLGRQKPDIATAYSYPVPAGAEYTVTFTPDNKVEFACSEGFREELVEKGNYQLDISDTIRILNGTVFGLYWGDAVIIFLSVLIFIITLILFQATYFIGRFQFRRKIKKGWIPKDSKYHVIPTLCVYSIFMLFLIMEFYKALLPDRPGMILCFKIVIGTLSVLIALSGYLRKKTRLSLITLLALILLMAADTVTTKSLIFGPALHITAYLLLSYAFYREEKPVRRQIYAWLSGSLVAACILLLIKGEYGAMRLLAIIYVVAAILMVTLSVTLRRRVMIGALLLFLSGILLMVNEVNGKTFLSHIISLGTYYAAIAVMASTCIHTVRYKLVPEVSLEDTEEEDDAAAEETAQEE